MDMHMYPVWEKEVHDILQPLFKELQLIFLAYTRSISEDSAEDAVEMSLDEFHDFVVDVGLETKNYRFDVMSIQFVKANATNTAAVRAQHQQSRRDTSARAKGAQGSDVGDDEQAECGQGERQRQGRFFEAKVKKDAELVLYEFLVVLIRIAFWRANPTFGNWVDKDGDGKMDKNEDFVPVPLALSQMLNDHVLPKAKRENSAAFREKEMKEASVKTALTTWRPKLKEWYTELQQGANSADNDDKMSFDEWLKALRRPHEANAERSHIEMCGEWEIEQCSEITADPSARGVHIKCRLSIATCKAAFMDSQRVEELGVGQAAVNSAQTVLAFDEFAKCVARCGTAKYFAVKQMDNGQKIAAFCRNLLGETSEENCMREATTVRAVRYDLSKSRPLPNESAEAHKAFLDVFTRMRLDGLYGFPLWEKEVHDLIHVSLKEISSIFTAYKIARRDGQHPLREGEGRIEPDNVARRVPRFCG